jgi:PTH1 family peptidyl-tRNA hydrolase
MKYLIVGLGNIGDEYAQTRHNIGFLVADFLVKNLSGNFQTQKLAQIAECKYKGRTLIVAKPSTYMNLSGKALRYYLEKENIPKTNVLVIVDDIALGFGILRLRSSGTHAGHNGLRNIEEELRSNIYSRLRIGIGNDFIKGKQVEYVLGEWNNDEQTSLPNIIENAVSCVQSFVFCRIGKYNEHV